MIFWLFRWTIKFIANIVKFSLKLCTNIVRLYTMSFSKMFKRHFLNTMPSRQTHNNFCFLIKVLKKRPICKNHFVSGIQYDFVYFGHTFQTRIFLLQLRCQVHHVLKKYFMVANYMCLAVVFVREERTMRWFYGIRWRLPIFIVAFHSYIR